MYVDVAVTTDDICADGTEMASEDLSVFYAEMLKCRPPETWELNLPPTEPGKVVHTPHGALGMQLRPGEGVALNDVVAFSYTGPEPVAKLAFSPNFTCAQDPRAYCLLTVVKHFDAAALAAHAVNDPVTKCATLQHWLIVCSEKADPVIINRLQILSGMPRDIKWLKNRVGNSGLMGYVANDNAFRLCKVTLGTHPTAISHEEILKLNAQKYTCFDCIRKIGNDDSLYRIALGSADGYVYFYDLEWTIDQEASTGPAGDCKLVASACYFVDTYAIYAISFMPSADGYIFAVGMASGRLYTCDIRLSGGVNHYHHDYLTQAIETIEWSDDNNFIVTIQHDGALLSPMHCESSRHHFLRAIMPRAGAKTAEELTESQLYWSRVLCPVWRSSDRAKYIDLRGTSCATSAHNIAFTFAGGAIMVGDTQMCDLKQYVDCNLFMWNLLDVECLKKLERPICEQEECTKTPKREKQDGGLANLDSSQKALDAKVLLKDSKNLVEQLIRETARAACERGVHICHTPYMEHDRIFKNLQQSVPVQSTRQDLNLPNALSITTAAGGIDHKIFAYGSQFGLVQLHQPDGPASGTT